MRRWVWLLAVMVLGGGPLAATEVKVFRLQSQDAFLQGTLDGVSADALGTLRLAARAERLASLSEPFVLAAAGHPEGWVVGTGNEGRVLLVSRDGTARELFAADEPEVFAVAVGDDGSVYAGGSPNGKVYRHRDGETEVFFDPEQVYIWQLVPRDDGSLLVATGTQGKLFAVGPSGRGRVVWDSDDTHVRSLLPASDGAILAGTAGEGLIVRIAAGGGVETLYDAPQPEVVGFTAGPGGTAWAGVVASETSQLPAPKADDDDQASEDDGEDTTVVVVEEGGDQMIGSRPPGFSGARSEVLRIAASGFVEPIARLDDDTIFSLRWEGGRLWVGTGLEGKLFALEDDQLVLENDVEERQIVALLPGDGTLPAFATTNAAALYTLTRSDARRGTYTSPVLDAGQVARFGTFRWLGEAPSGAEVEVSFRSGSSSEPDPTWSDWTTPRAGRELGLEGVPSGRFVQFRAELSTRGESPALAGAELSYRQVNLAPRITRLMVMEPGQIQVPYNFNPSDQTFEPVHPNRDGIFTTIEATSADSDRRFKTLWKRGYRTLVWTASDPNSDALEFAIELRPEGLQDWLPLVEELELTHASFDASVLPDGIYRFRLTAADRPEGREGRLITRRISEPVIVDHAPPRVEQTRRERDRLVVQVQDDLNPLRTAEYSVDAGEWTPATPVDGLLDGRTERLEIAAGAGARLVILRLVDAAFNTVTVDLSAEVR